ncbi:aldo/keto reductase [Nakamurella silvestris]|nr:aldo/keto reductase [Nakamurella silvestris]
MTAATTSPFRPLVLGGASFGGLFKPVTDEHVAAALEFAWDNGVRAFDTAPHYGVGLSEERVGAFLATKPRDEFVLSTKVGRLLVDDPDAVDGTDAFFGTPRRSRVLDYSADGVSRSVEASLERLGLDRVDLLLIHDAEDHMTQAIGEAYPALDRMRAEGLVGGIGVGMNDAAAARTFVEETDIDHVMIAGRYSLLDRSAEVDLLPACARRGVAVLVAGVFNSGLLADPRKQATFNYAEAPVELVERAVAMQRACEKHGVGLRAAALQFSARNPAVTAVVSGAGSITSLTDTFTQLSADLPEELWAELDQLALPVGGPAR